MPGNEPKIDALRAEYLQRRVGPYIAWNPVSRTQVWQWCSAMGDRNPLYLEEGQVIAPPTMLQMWTFRDVHGTYSPGSTDKDTYEVLGRLADMGFKGTVAVSYDQTYHAYLGEGDRVYSYSTIIELSELKSTGLGEGHFVTELAEYFIGEDQLIGEARITYFKYRVPERTAETPTEITRPKRIAPVENHDSRHFWAGLRDGLLLIQECSDCGQRRHPPQPMCEKCQSLEWRTTESAGLGTIYSFTVLHYPEIPPFDYPNAIVLVELDEGVRIVSQLRGSEPENIQIGQRVQASIESVQDQLSLPIFEVITP